MNYDPEPDSHSKNKVKVGLDFPNYAIKSKIKKNQQVGYIRFC